MSNVNKHITIPKNVSSNDDLSFDFLRQKGIEHIQSLGSQFWTDYNTHDPGITILEVLAYAITDLGMRIDLPINDLLSTDSVNSYENQFFSASEILPNKALTAFDYRKIIIDIDPSRIKNCWIQTTTKKLYVDCKEGKISLNKKDLSSENFIKETDVKGFYTILVDFESEKSNSVAAIKKIKETIKEKFHQNRNLCEDLDEVKEVETHPISVCAQIEIDPDADEEMVQALITIELEKYLAPSVQFYSLKEMTDKMYTSDQIFEGPLLDHGFIDTAELEASSLRTEVRLSDIINIIMNVEGVRVISDISINNCGEEASTTDNWNLCIPKNKKPKLCDKSTFSFKKGVLPVNSNATKVEEYIADLKFDAKEKQSKASENKELKIPTGIDYNSDNYSSVTHNFPETYGIGDIGLSETVTVERKAKANQLKGYLLFFDQILTSYFKHLSNVKKLLSINNDLPKTYFTQAVKGIKKIEELVDDEYDLENDSALGEKLFGDLDNSIKRQNQLKDHLIARFAERFSEYSFLMKSLYGSTSDTIVLQNKADFLSNYDTISSQRACALNYYKQSPINLWDTFNVSGLENRIAGLLGIKMDVKPNGKKGIKRQNLTNLHYEIYNPTPEIPGMKFRWRIRNTKNKIILTATENYPSEIDAIKEMNTAINKIQHTIESDIESGFATLIENRGNGTPFSDTVMGTFEVIESDSHRYSFHIINPKFVADLSNPDRIIARQYKLFGTLEETQNAMLQLIGFFKREFDEGIFLVEHLLLLPKNKGETTVSHYMPICIDDCSDECCIPDPYSFKISVVLPGYTYRFLDVDFRNFAEDVIRQEIPSHILGKICWIGHRKGSVDDDENDMLRFEKTFKQFLADKSNDKQDHLPEFIEALGELNSIYNVGELFDCTDETDDITGKIILGRTNLGTI